MRKEERVPEPMHLHWFGTILQAHAAPVPVPPTPAPVLHPGSQQLATLTDGGHAILTSHAFQLPHGQCLLRFSTQLFLEDSPTDLRGVTNPSIAIEQLISEAVEVDLKAPSFYMNINCEIQPQSTSMTSKRKL
ncbi:hypothetical protein WMY93_028747 [Mugilogobius chulae]|uniref:Uncharacterized protein n=1 Tax=Mugilogobius chulae TaxID=88201 RepID=A0AAW0N1H9_9GOBI